MDGGNAYQYDRLAKVLQEAQKELAAAQSELELDETRLENAQNALDELETKYSEYKAAVEAARDAQTALEDKIFELEEQQKTDGKEQALHSLEIDKLREQIADAEAEVERLQSGAVDATVTSKVNGTVKSLGVTAGHNTEPGVAMATIEVPDRGYSVDITVTAEQQRRSSVGDSADISTGWWGAQEITATLASIRPDPQAPNQSKILGFDIAARLEDGTQVSLSIGQKSQNYEVIVPNSAIRSDSNGDFVLIVLARSTPLGNRYIATRVDVQVLASDDLNSAISGGVTNGTLS
jgi:multidrug efflux pump subunit AcrA (membrane-fusion protein)